MTTKMTFLLRRIPRRAPCTWSQLLFLGTSATAPVFYGLLVVQEGYAILRNLGYTNRLFNAFLGLCAKRGATGAELEEQQQRHAARLERQARNLSVYAPCSNIGVGVAPVILLLMLAAEQGYEAVSPQPLKASHLRGGLLTAWRNGVSPGETAVMLVVLFVLRAAFLKVQLALHSRQANRAPAKHAAATGAPTDSLAAPAEGENKPDEKKEDSNDSGDHEFSDLFNLLFGGSDPTGRKAFLLLVVSMSISFIADCATYANCILA